MKKLLITGGAGWFGKKLVKYYYNKYDITILSRNEKNQWNLKQNYPKINCILHDITKSFNFENIYDIIIHAAALKHVRTGIDYPIETIDINIIGTINVLQYAIKSIYTKFIYISTDKAVESANLYGATKYVGEKLVEYYKQKGLNASIVRFGNLFGSSGSIIEILLKKMLWQENKFDISSFDSERYFLKWQDAAILIDKAIETNEFLIIGSYKKLKIVDLIKYIFNNPKINIIGLREGEKTREKLTIDYIDKDEYYTKEEVLAMWEEAKQFEIGDMLS